jgi:competence protein ComGC
MKRKNAFSIIEIILSVVLLSIFSVVFINLFVTADRLNKRAEELDMGVVTSTNIVERIRVSHDIEDLAIYEDLKLAYFESASKHKNMFLGYDENWAGLDYNSDQAVYQLIVTETQEESHLSYVVSIYNGESMIYELEFIK